jgi:hypothetical protein
MKTELEGGRWHNKNAELLVVDARELQAWHFKRLQNIPSLTSASQPAAGLASSSTGQEILEGSSTMAS